MLSTKNEQQFCNKNETGGHTKIWPNQARLPTRSTILEFQKSNTQTTLSGKAGQCVNQNNE